MSQTFAVWTGRNLWSPFSWKGAENQQICKQQRCRLFGSYLTRGAPLYFLTWPYWLVISGQPYLVVMGRVFTECSIILSSSFLYSSLGKQVGFHFPHTLSENIQSGHKVINGKDCGDKVMAEAPSLSFFLAHWTTLFLSCDRRVGTGQRWEKPEQQALAETSNSLLPAGRLSTCWTAEGQWCLALWDSGVWRKAARNPLWEGFCGGSSWYLSSSTWLALLLNCCVCSPERTYFTSGAP